MIGMMSCEPLTSETVWMSIWDVDITSCSGGVVMTDVRLGLGWRCDGAGGACRTCTLTIET